MTYTSKVLRNLSVCGNKQKNWDVEAGKMAFAKGSGGATLTWDTRGGVIFQWGNLKALEPVCMKWILYPLDRVNSNQGYDFRASQWLRCCGEKLLALLEGLRCPPSAGLYPGALSQKGRLGVTCTCCTRTWKVHLCKIPEQKPRHPFIGHLKN